MSVVTRTIANALGIAPDSASRIIASAITVVAVLVVRWVLLWIVGRRTQDSGMQYRWRKWSAYVAAFAGIIVLGRIWFSGVQSLVTYLGLVSAGVAIALREPIANVFGWIFLSSRRSFVVGDRISVADAAEIRIRLTGYSFARWVCVVTIDGRDLATWIKENKLTKADLCPDE